VLVDPENGWNEIVTPESLACRGELARRWEVVPRKELFWRESVLDDKHLEALFEVGYTYTDTEWEMPDSYRGGAAGKSYTWEGTARFAEHAQRIGVPQMDSNSTRETLAPAAEGLSRYSRLRTAGLVVEPWTDVGPGPAGRIGEDALPHVRRPGHCPLDHGASP
jgi:hypothetical protein